MSKNLSPDSYKVAALIIGSIAASVSLILLNKIVMNKFQFKYVMALSAFHFLATAAFSRISASFGLFVPKRHSMPPIVVFAVAFAGTASVVFMNLSLHKNSVGFYQMTKLLCIPYMVAHTRFVKGTKISLELLLSLFFILCGVGIATVTDIQFNTEGTIYGLVAVISTAQFQIWQGTKQSEYSLNPMQITDIIMPVQFVLCSILSLLIESSLISQQEHGTIETFEWSSILVYLLLLTAAIAVAVNVLSFALIGKTSAVTYQVVGHFKTILTLVGGYFIFTAGKTETSFTNVSGILIGLFGMYLYGDVKTNAEEPTLLYKFTGNLIPWKKKF